LRCLMTRIALIRCTLPQDPFWSMVTNNRLSLQMKSVC
jgi:hypothetical protein